MGANKEEIRELSSSLSVMSYKDFTYYDDEAEYLTDQGWRDARRVADEVRKEVTLSLEEAQALMSGHILALEASIEVSKWEATNKKDLLPVVYSHAYNDALEDMRGLIANAIEKYKERYDA